MITTEKAVKKGIIGGSQRFSTEDGPGIRTTFFLKGCPLRCQWCHNPELFSMEQDLMHAPSRCIGCGDCVKVCPQKAITMTEDGPEIQREQCDICGICAENCCAEALRMVGDVLSVEEVVDIALRDEDFYQSTGGGVTLSGGEILANGPFAMAIADACREQGISVAIETSGFGSYDTLYSLSQKSDHVLYDVKMMDAEKHKKYIGVDNVQIFENLKMLASDEEIRHKISIRMPLMAGLNDSLEDVLQAAEFIKSLGLPSLELLPYHSMGVSKARQTGRTQPEFAPPSDDHLRTLKTALENAGLTAHVLGLE